MKLITSALIKTINHFIKNELWARELLKNHIGKTACIKNDLTELQMSVNADGFFYSHNEIALEKNSDELADVTLYITPHAYSACLKDGFEGLQKQIKVSGDAEFASTLSKILNQIRWEPEESLAQLIGDLPAYQLNKIGKNIIKTSNHIGNNLLRSIADYMFDEKSELLPQLVRTPLLDHFKDSVADLRDNVSRVEKRIYLLEQSVNRESKK